MEREEIVNYQLPLLGMSQGTHCYTLSLDASLLKEVKGQGVAPWFAHCLGEADIEAVKTHQMVRLHFDIHARVEMVCDRTLRSYMESLSFQETLYIKYAQEAETLSEDLVSVPYGVRRYNLRPHLYDYISLALPMQRLHPEIREKEEDFTYTLQARLPRRATEAADGCVDERWRPLAALLTLKAE